MKINLVLLITILINCSPFISHNIENASCIDGNDNVTIVESNHIINPDEYGGLGNYIPNLVSQKTLIAINGADNDKTEIIPTQKENPSHTEALNRIKKSIEIPPLRNNLIIIGKSDDARVKLLTNSDNTEISPPPSPPIADTTVKQHVMDYRKSVKVQLDVPANMNVCLNMAVENGTSPMKKNYGYEEKNFDYPFKFSKPCVDSIGNIYCNMTSDEIMKYCQKCLCCCCSNPDKKCECRNINQPKTAMKEDSTLTNSDTSHFLNNNERKAIIKQDDSTKNDASDLKHVEKRRDLASNRNNIIIIGKDEGRDCPPGAATFVPGSLSPSQGLRNSSSSTSGQSNGVKVQLDVPIDSELHFNITVTNGTTKYEKSVTDLKDSEYEDPKLNVAELKSALETTRTETKNMSATNYPSSTTFMKKDNTTTVYSQESTPRLGTDSDETNTIKHKHEEQINNVTTSPMKRKLKKYSKNISKYSGKDPAKKHFIHKKKSKNTFDNAKNLLRNNSSIDTTHPNMGG